MATQLHEPAPTRNPVIEFVGPAGAGKSTILAIVASMLNDPRRVEPAAGRARGQTARLALRHVHDWGPAAAAVVRRDPRTSRELLRHLIRVRTFAAELPRLRASVHTAVLLDEGPVLSLAQLSRAQELAANPALERYLAASLALWGAAFDLIIHVDAPDAVLARRIHERSKSHRMKGRSDIEVRGFLGWYRRHYDAVLRSLQSDGVRVVHLDSSADSADVLAARVVALVSGGAHAP